MNIPQCEVDDEAKEDDYTDILSDDIGVPMWEEITQPNKTIEVIFDMENDLARGLDGVVKIQKNMTRRIRFAHGRWFTTDQDGKFHMFSGYRNGKSGELENHKLSVFGLVLNYNSKYGSLELSEADLKESKKIYPNLRENQVGFPLARVIVLEDNASIGQKRSSALKPSNLCNVKWSNALRLDPTTGGGRCLQFTASSAGDFFVVFATLPTKPSTWYYVRIGTEEVAIYKV